jgi:hypothetical protein
MNATTITVPTIWLVLPVLAGLSCAYFVAVKWVLDRYVDPWVVRFIVRHSKGITVEDVERWRAERSPRD